MSGGAALRESLSEVRESVRAEQKGEEEEEEEERGRSSKFDKLRGLIDNMEMNINQMYFTRVCVPFEEVPFKPFIFTFQVVTRIQRNVRSFLRKQRIRRAARYMAKMLFLYRKLKSADVAIAQANFFYKYEQSFK